VEPISTGTLKNGTTCGKFTGQNGDFWVSEGIFRGKRAFEGLPEGEFSTTTPEIGVTCGKIFHRYPQKWHHLWKSHTLRQYSTLHSPPQDIECLLMA